MSVQDILSGMRKRMPWSVGQKILAEAGLDRGQGWERTVTKFEDPKAVTGEKEAALSDTLKEHLICGEKLSRFYEVPPENKAHLEAVLGAAAIEDTAFKRRYPALLSEEELKRQERGLKLVAVERFNDGMAGIFSSVRTITIRVPLERDELPAAAAEALEGYDEVVGIKNLRLQAFDIVWVPAVGNLLEIRVDYPRGMQLANGEAAQEQLRDHVHAMSSFAVFGEPDNLFPLIDRIYRQPNEGTVVELSFGTTTASTKHEKMRRQSLDLRTELYHVGGVKNLVAPIQPFRLAVRWRRAMGEALFSHPELNLNGYQHHDGAENSRLFSAVIRNCVGIDDYEHVRSRISHHLANDTK